MLRQLSAFLLCLVCGFANAAQGGVDPSSVTVDYREGHYFGSVRFLVDVPQSLALAVLTDFDNMARFVPNLSKSRVVERDGPVYRVTQEGKAGYGPFSFRFNSERRIEVFPDGRVVAVGLSGSASYLRTELQLQAQGAGETLITYRIDLVPGQWMPSVVGVGFLRHELAEQFSALADEMRRRRNNPQP